MREFPKGGLIGKTVHFMRRVSSFQVPLYAANASFFLVLAVFPALLLLLSLLRYTSLEVERLGELLQWVIPEALLASAEELILMTYDKSSGAMVGISAVAALWSASRGIYGLLTGLNAIYGAEETRSYLHIRVLCMGYTFVFLLVLLLTLGLHVFGGALLNLLRQLALPVFRLLTDFLDLRLFLLLSVQTAIFTAMFLALPNRRGTLRGSLPGALLASSGWLLFSALYSVYVEHFARLSNVFGSVYAVALSMLWLYCCISIVFYGGVLNRFWAEA